MVDPISLAKRYSHTAPQKLHRHWSHHAINIIVFPFVMVASAVLVIFACLSIALAWPIEDEKTPKFIREALKYGTFICIGVASALLWRMVFPA